MMLRAESMLRESENSVHREIFRHIREEVSGRWVKIALPEASWFVFFHQALLR